MNETDTAATKAASAPKSKMEDAFRTGLLIVLLLVMFLGLMRAYIALDEAIALWFLDQYVPLMQALFSLAIVGLAAWLIRAYVIGRRKA